jgi:hypothetical protein
MLWIAISLCVTQNLASFMEPWTTRSKNIERYRSFKTKLNRGGFSWGAGPPGTNYVVMKRAFEEGWGAVIAKTVSLDSSKARTLLADFGVIASLSIVHHALILLGQLICAWSVLRGFN